MYTREELKKNCVISCIPERQVVLDGQARGHPTIAYLDTEEYKRTLNGKTDKKIPKWVWTKVKQPSEAQKKRMVALVLMSITKTLLQNHLQWEVVQTGIGRT